MPQRTSRVRGVLTRLRVLDQLVGLGAGAASVVALASTLVLFGGSSEQALEDAWTPPPASASE